MADPIDEIEARVDKAFAGAYRDGPEFMELRQAVEVLRVDRRRLLSMSPGAAFDVWADAMARESEKTAEVMSKEAEKAAKKVRGFMGDIRSALERFGKDE